MSSPSSRALGSSPNERRASNRPSRFQPSGSSRASSFSFSVQPGVSFQAPVVFFVARLDDHARSFSVLPNASPGSHSFCFATTSRKSEIDQKSTKILQQGTATYSFSTPRSINTTTSCPPKFSLRPLTKVDISVLEVLGSDGMIYRMNGL